MNREFEGGETQLVVVQGFFAVLEGLVGGRSLAGVWEENVTAVGREWEAVARG